jgi:hypothetical protein
MAGGHVPPAHLVLGRARAGPEDDEGVRRLAPPLVQQADDGRLLDGRVAEQDALDLDRGDVLAAASPAWNRPPRKASAAASGSR